MKIRLSKAFLGAALLGASAIAAELDFPEVSRCFFVYAPLHEVATSHADEQLRQYSLQRLMYVRGLVESNKSNERFVAAFDGGLRANKAAGVTIERDLGRAYRDGDVALYNATLKKAEVCDLRLNLLPRK